MLFGLPKCSVKGWMKTEQAGRAPKKEGMLTFPVSLGVAGTGTSPGIGGPDGLEDRELVRGIPPPQPAVSIQL